MVQIPNIDSIENYVADSSKGFKIYGSNIGDRLGSAVSSAGDINGDGLIDLVVGAPSASPNVLREAGAAYVIYGDKHGHNIDSISKYLGEPSKGFKIYGSNNDGRLGSSVSTVGDVNGDGIDDIIISVLGIGDTSHSLGTNGRGATYLIYGNKLGIPNIDSIESYLADISKGCKVSGFGKSLNVPTNVLLSTGVWGLGNSVAPAGDINGDGVSDIIIGAVTAIILGGQWRIGGSAYVLYGNEDGIPNVGSIEDYITIPSKGFRAFYSKSSYLKSVYEVSPDDNHHPFLYPSVSAAGDVNGDGVDDIIVGVSGASPNGLTSAGVAYVIYGKKGGMPDVNNWQIPYEIDGAQGYLIDSSRGFKIYGSNSYDGLGNAVSSAGDMNGDGIADIIVGASGASPKKLNGAGAAYVIYGVKGGISNINSIEDYLIESSKGFKIYASNKGDSLGNSVSLAGDLNGDGLSDIIIGTANAGAAYLIYGKKEGIYNIDSITSYLSKYSNGFAIRGSVSDCFGYPVASAGDINGDGLVDIIIGANCASPNGLANAGAVYVVYGASDLKIIDGSPHKETILSLEAKLALGTGALLSVAVTSWLLWKYCYQGKFCTIIPATKITTNPVPSAPIEEVQLIDNLKTLEVKELGEYNDLLFSPPSYNEAIIE